MDWQADFFEAKYHLSVAERMMEKYEECFEKRFLIGVINESARAVSKLIWALAKLENFRGNKKNKSNVVKWFIREIGPKHLNKVTHENLIKVLEIEQAQKVSPIEFMRKGKIILLIRGRYRILTATRIGEFVKSIKDGIFVFSENFRQI